MTIGGERSQSVAELALAPPKVPISMTSSGRASQIRCSYVRRSSRELGQRRPRIGIEHMLGQAAEPVVPEGRARELNSYGPRQLVHRHQACDLVPRDP